MSVFDQQLELLRLIRDATRAGLITWQESEEDSDWFYADSPLASYIHFKWPAYNGNDGSDRDFVDVGGARFTVGTEGWLLALEILAAGFESWQQHLEAIQQHNSKMIDALRKSLDDQ